MNSDESDDEPLSMIASKKDIDEDYESEDESSFDSERSLSPIQKRKKRKRNYNIDIPLELNADKLQLYLPSVQIPRPVDVWLYLKDLSANGPYSCLLCSEWFINKSKIVIHYILNHKKDYCGICRYFVIDAEKWEIHQSFHTPRTCSQCPLQFEWDQDLIAHFSSVHNSVHCRLCCFMISDGEEYNRHLFSKHNVINITNKNNEYPWQIEYDGSPKFLCSFCTKNPLVADFFRHYMCYHRFTLKCFTYLLSGRDIPFSIEGADISKDFLATHLQEQFKYGYVQPKPIDSDPKTVYADDNSHNLLQALIPEIKQEIVDEDNEERGSIHDNEETEQAPLEEETVEKAILLDEGVTAKEVQNSYKGEENFDITLTEVVILQEVYYNYIDSIVTQNSSRKFHRLSKIDFTLLNYCENMNINCPICDDKDINLTDFTSHLLKIHSVKCIPNFFCRICAATFENEPEFRSHEFEEISDFENLWICQFCDDEFLNREETRLHLEKHLENMNSNNCFSPHLGFKCRYCPTLFWNEFDREAHHTEIHYANYTKDFYKCSLCNEISSDKVWFSYHMLKQHKHEDFNNMIYLLKCTICALVFPNIEQIKGHFDSQHPEATKIFCCMPPCKWRPLSQRKIFKMHLKTVHEAKSITTKNGVEHNHSCGICGRDFSTPKACNTHMSLAHGPCRFKCKFCPASMHSGDERKLHYLIKHPGQYHFECKLCKKTFQYKSSLYIHKNNVHAKIKEPHTCTYCGKVFMKRESYREHMQIHEGPRHTCSYCPMRFVQRSNMLRHERRHTGERPYACSQCPRTFADKGACSSHEKTHNRDTVNACMYCGQTFVQKSKLTYHIRKHTGENLEPCPVCSKLFTNSYALREHLKRHVGKNTIPCPICGKQFSDQSNIMKHIRRMHSELSAKSCPLCNKVLSTIIGLRKHLFTHSNVKQFHCRRCGKTYSNKKSILKHLMKRHRIKGESSHLIKQLDPRDCNLGISEEIITQIFGKRKRKYDEVMIENTITLKDLPFLKIPKEESKVTEDEASNSEHEGEENNTEDPIDNNQEKYNLEPTSFVSIKIEPLEDIEDETD